MIHFSVYDGPIALPHGERLRKALNQIDLFVNLLELRRGYGINFLNGCLGEGRCSCAVNSEYVAPRFRGCFLLETLRIIDITFFSWRWLRLLYPIKPRRSCIESELSIA